MIPRLLENRVQRWLGQFPAVLFLRFVPRLLPVHPRFGEQFAVEAINGGGGELMQRSGADAESQMSRDHALVADKRGRAYGVLDGREPLVLQEFGQGDFSRLDVGAVLKVAENVIESDFGILLGPETRTTALAAFDPQHELPTA